MKEFLTITVILFLGACVQDQQVLITVDHTDPALTLHGDTLYFRQNKFSGNVLGRYANGDPASFTSYRNGLQHGMQKTWYSNKTVSEIRYFDMGQKAGTHKGYWEDGSLKFEYEFHGGEHHGVLREWYRNGQPYKVFHYDKGYESGSQKMWWENGLIRANYVVKNGRRYGLIGLKLCVNPKMKTN
jgi:antitoxin component YwqK of YwqJK toxin-antitoxin module